MNLLCVGSIAYDTIKTPFGAKKRALGGSATYFSLAARLFAPVSIVAVVGDDFADINAFKRAKIDLSGLEQARGKTFHWAGRYHFDLNTRETLKTELGVFANFNPKLSENHKQAEYVFLGNIHPKLQLAVLRQIKNPKLVGLDTMNFWIERAPQDLQKVLREIDMLIINDSEARELSEERNIYKAARKILKMMRHAVEAGLKPAATLIIKRGEYGLLMFNSSPLHKGRLGGVFHLPGYPLEDVVDPTGAGDSFAGGLMGFLTKTDDASWKNLKAACVHGSCMASFCVEKFGTLKLQNLKPHEIKNRLEHFKHLTKF